MDRLESMSILISVVEAGSLSGASRRLKMPLPSLSRKISELEAHLRVKLLNRSTRLLTLTDSGAAYLAACKRILEDIETAERAAAGEYSEPKGELVITSPVVFGRVHMLPVVSEFLRVYPQISVRLTLNDRVVNLQEDHIDLAARIGRLPDSSLTAIRLGEVRRVICAAPDYLQRQGAPQHPSDLINHDCISFVPLVQADNWDFPGQRGTETYPVRARLVVTTAEATVDAAVAGIGVARVFCYHIAEARRAGKLKLLLQSFEPPALPVHLIFPEGRLIPLKLRAFLDFAAPRLRAQLARANFDDQQAQAK